MSIGEKSLLKVKVLLFLFINTSKYSYLLLICAEGVVGFHAMFFERVKSKYLKMKIGSHMVLSSCAVHFITT